MLCPCRKCHRHVDSRDPRCPFCGAEKGPCVPVILPDPRLSRAAQAAFVFLVSTSSCRPSTETQNPVVPAAPSARATPSATTSASAAPSQSAAPTQSAGPSQSAAWSAEPPTEDPSPPTIIAMYGTSCVGLFQQVTFGFESARVSKTEADWLSALKELFDQYPELVIELRGHADARERRANALSERRARAVRDALVRMGIRPEGFVVVGCGNVVPIAEKGDAANRRVELVLVGGVPDEAICTPRPSECRDVEE